MWSIDRRKTVRRRKCLAFAIIVAVAILVPLSLWAEEGGSGHYTPGAAASFIDALPDKPGLAVANYFNYYDGSASISRPLPIGGTGYGRPRCYGLLGYNPGIVHNTSKVAGWLLHSRGSHPVYLVEGQGQYPCYRTSGASHHPRRQRHCQRHRRHPSLPIHARVDRPQWRPQVRCTHGCLCTHRLLREG